MEKFDRLAKRVGNFFEGFMEAAMATLGLCLICFIFVELWHLVELTPFLSGAKISIDSILSSLINFFLLLEFLAMAAAAMQNHGHLAADFLISLGITALLRGLIAEHEAPMQNVLTCLAILALIIGEILMHWQSNREHHDNK
ncbi:phosphate-starvation-inducible PsiE family protein [Limosilactobacillus mucosae]|uniref:phosphate-starvation-inducible PsiE family protein n=1 Tax=Limosilactobacillus mucosae TaxID=97478 RepID=UPI00399688E1